ncbi:MAG: hypothetical protein ACP5PL_03850 [Infirmifilum sp.]
MVAIDATRPSRLSLLGRYAFPVIVLVFATGDFLGQFTIYVPLVLLGIYHLFSYELGWPEKFFTLVLYSYSFGLSLIGYSSLNDSFFLGSLILSPIALITIDVERLFSEYRLTRSTLEIRGIRKDSIIPRLTVRYIPTYLIEEVRIKKPILSRLFRLRYLDLSVGTPAGGIMFKGIREDSSLFKNLIGLASGVDLPHKETEKIILYSSGDGFEVKGSFNREKAHNPLTIFYRFLLFFSYTFNSTLHVEDGLNSQSNTSKEDENSLTRMSEKDKKAPRDSRLRNRIERLL